MRYFKRFMAMILPAYARLGKPLMAAVGRARMQAAGPAMQGLHAGDDAERT